MLYSSVGLLFSVLITAVITDAIKDGVGRPRPDFFWIVFRMAKGWVSCLVSQLLPSCLSCVPSLGEYGVPFENYLTCYITGLQ